MHSMSRVPQMTVTVRRPGPPPFILTRGTSAAPKPVRAANSEAMRIQALSRAGTPDVSGAGAMLTRLASDLPVDPMASMYAASAHERARKMSPPSRQGVGVSGVIMQREVTRGLSLSGGLGGTAACESTGARVAQGILGATAGVLTSLGSGGFRSEQASGNGGVVGSNMSGGTQQNLAIAGASINIAGSIYTGVCDARMASRGIAQPAATQTMSDWRTAAGGITQQIQQARQVSSTSTQPQVSNPPAQDQAQAQMDAQAGAVGANAPESKTWMYVAGGVAAAGLLAFVVTR